MTPEERLIAELRATNTLLRAQLMASGTPLPVESVSMPTVPPPISVKPIIPEVPEPIESKPIIPKV